MSEIKEQAIREAIQAVRLDSHTPVLHVEEEIPMIVKDGEKVSLLFRGQSMKTRALGGLPGFVLIEMPAHVFAELRGRLTEHKD